MENELERRLAVELGVRVRSGSFTYPLFMALLGALTPIWEVYPQLYLGATALICVGAAWRALASHRAVAAEEGTWRARRGEVRLASLFLLGIWLLIAIACLAEYPREPITIAIVVAVMGWTSVGASVFAPDPWLSAAWLNLHILPVAFWSWMVRDLYGEILCAVIIVFWIFVYALNQRSNRHLLNMMRTQLALEEQTEELRRAKQETEAALKARTLFVANMSHEIRTPLNGVIGAANLLEFTSLNDEQKELVETMQFSGRLLLGIVNDVLDFAKLSEGRVELERAKLTAQSFLRQACLPFEIPAREKGLDFRFQAEPETLEFQGDPLRLAQVVTNLVGNAIKFTERGRVFVRAFRLENGWIRIEVADSGIGIAEAKKQAIFEEFVQAERGTTRRFGGTGLGLAICARLVNLMHGQLGVESVEGEGSVFWVEIPQPTSEIRK